MALRDVLVNVLFAFSLLRLARALESPPPPELLALQYNMGNEEKVHMSTVYAVRLGKLYHCHVITYNIDSLQIPRCREAWAHCVSVQGSCMHAHVCGRS